MRQTLSLSVSVLVLAAGFSAAGFGCSENDPRSSKSVTTSTGGTASTSGGSGGAANTTGGAGVNSSGGIGSNLATGGIGSGTGGAASGGTASASGGATNPGDPPAKYLSYCAVCHGVTGVGSTKAPEALHPDHGYGEWLVRNGMAARNGWDPMLPIGVAEISDAELQEIWAFLDAPPRPTEGKAMYDDYCLHCHGTDAVGKMGVSDKYIKGLSADAFLEGVRVGGTATTPATRLEYMPPIGAGVLSDADVTKIFEYAKGL